MSLKLIIAGPTQSGKTTLAKILNERLGMTVLKTCTTRPKRTPDEDSYNFYSIEEYEKLRPSEKFMETKGLDQYARWANPKDLMAADISILDPIGIPDAVKLLQTNGYPVCILYMRASEYLRKHVALTQTGFTEEDYDFRANKEAPLFEELEKAAKCNVVPYSAAHFISWMNMMTKDGTDEIVNKIKDVRDKFAGVAEIRLGYDISGPNVIKRESMDMADWDAFCRIMGLNSKLTHEITLDLRGVEAKIKAAP